MVLVVVNGAFKTSKKNSLKLVCGGLTISEAVTRYEELAFSDDAVPYM